jgi:LmbE family N-acetylglucosaminyl deacetylase
MGGAFARYSPFAHVTAICATRGELGEIASPDLATPENLGEVREGELREACRRLGVTDVRFLDYRDSGMAGTPGNEDPRAFSRADPDEVIGRLVRIFRELAPDAVVTFEQTGAYGHPDHLMIHRVTTEAFAAASNPDVYPDAGPAVRAGRLFYSGFPRGVMRRFVEGLSEAGVDLGDLGQIDYDSVGMPDDVVDVELDVSAEYERKMSAARAHRTQVEGDNWMTQAPEEVRRLFSAHEYYQLAAGEPLPGPRPAHDLLPEFGSPDVAERR